MVIRLRMDVLSSSAPGACKLVGWSNAGPARSARWEFNKELSQDRITTDPITHSHHCDPKMMPATRTAREKGNTPVVPAERSNREISNQSPS